jgi:WD40 repeat protein
MTEMISNQPSSRPVSRRFSRRTLLLGLGGLGIAGLGGGGVALWNYHREHTAIYTYTGYEGKINVVAWSPNGKRIACGGYNEDSFDLDQHGTTHIWDALTGRNLFVYHDPSSSGEVKALAWAPDSKHLASAGEDKAYVWEDGLNRAPLAIHQEPAPCAR